MMRYLGVIFDLDGVLVSTDECHYRAWKRMAEEEGIPFTRRDNDKLRGVSRMESLALVLERAKRRYSEEERMRLAERKNGYYVELISALTPGAVLPGARDWLEKLKRLGVRTAVGSSSRNAGLILQRTGLTEAFDAVADGTMLARSKPDPEVFVTAARLLDLPPASCLVVEDAEAGIRAARAGGMDVLGLGDAAKSQCATYRAASLAAADCENILLGVEYD